MRKMLLSIVSVGLFVLVSACQTSSFSYEENESTNANNVEITSDNHIEVVANVTMDAHNVKLLVIEVAQDCDVTLRYSYSTRNALGVKLGYFPEKEKKTVIKLKPMKDSNFKKTWFHKKISFKKGVNAIYLIGDHNQECEITLKIDDIDMNNVLYTGLHLHI